MIKFNCRNSLHPLLFATTLALALLSGGGAPVFAGSVSVTGANGATGAPGKPGGAGAPATATSMSSDSSNSATATGGNGGNGGSGSEFAAPFYPPGAGGHGGTATSTATASNITGSASATATSTGGNGGRGGLPTVCIHSCFPGPAGGGGAASAVSSATGGGAGTVTSDATASGGAAAHGSNNPAAGTASASASASSKGSGLVEANASAFDPSNFTGEYSGESGDRASATTSAQNESGSIVTMASAPRGSTASALSSANVFTAAMGVVPESLVAISAGHAVSNAALTPGGLRTPGSAPTIGVGAMSAGYGANSFAITYDATAVFDFTTSAKEEALDLNLTSDESTASSAGIGFDNLNLQVVNETTGVGMASLSFTSSSAAKTFFNGGQVSLGLVAAGPQSIEIEYFLTFAAGTSAAPGDGFGFTYTLKDPRLNVPEPSTWAMLIVGFVCMGVAGWRRGRAPDFPPRQAQ